MHVREKDQTVSGMYRTKNEYHKYTSTPLYLSLSVSTVHTNFNVYLILKQAASLNHTRKQMKITSVDL